MVSSGVRFFLPAAAIALLFSVGSPRIAAANDFTDACIAGGGGLFEAKDCACMDGKAKESADRTVLIAYFKINADIAKGGTPPSDSGPLMKGTEALNKYLGQCMK